MDNWTSKLRGRVPDFDAYDGRARAAFTYKDIQGKLTKDLYGSDTWADWDSSWPTYHLDVKTTDGSSKTSFRMTRDELTIVRPTH